MVLPKNSPTAPRKFAHFTLQPIGLGCMNLDHAYGPSVSVEQAERVLLAAPPPSKSSVKTACAAFSPVARGYLCGLRDLSGLDAKTIRRGMPRFNAENYAADLQLAVAYEQIAKEQGCTPAHLALAWLLHKAPHIIPIPGTTNAAHMRENLAAQSLVLSAPTMAKLDATINASNVQGPRYDVQSQSEVDTESGFV